MEEWHQWKGHWERSRPYLFPLHSPSTSHLSKPTHHLFGIPIVQLASSSPKSTSRHHTSTHNENRYSRHPSRPRSRHGHGIHLREAPASPHELRCPCPQWTAHHQPRHGRSVQGVCCFSRQCY